MTLDEAKAEFLKLLTSLECMPVNPWPFLCASAFIDYLSHMVTGRRSTRSDYKQFVSTYLVGVDARYDSFTYASGARDLPTQMYYILRCGIVHMFSFFPDSDAMNKGARSRSVLITHDTHDGPHLSNYKENGEDAALLVLHDFVSDLKRVTKQIFDAAGTNSQLKKNIEQHLQDHRPIVALPPIVTP